MDKDQIKSLSMTLIEKMRQSMPQVEKTQFVEMPIMSRVYFFGPESPSKPIGWMPIPSNAAEALLLIAFVDGGWHIFNDPLPFTKFYEAMLSALQNEKLPGDKDMTNVMSST